MSKLVSIQQQGANAFAAYVSNAINNPKVYPKPDWRHPLVVEPRWPDPKKLPARAITITFAGPRTNGSDSVLGWWHYAQKLNPQPPGLPAGVFMYRWVVGWYEQPVQMDIWTLYDVDRDDLIARLDVVLHSGPGELQPDQPGGRDPITDYLVIPLQQQDDWLKQVGGYVDCYFSDDGPTLIDTPIGAGQTMYRATWKGVLETLLTVDAPQASMAKAIFKMRMSETQVPTTGSYDVQITVSSSSGATWSSSVP